MSIGKSPVSIQKKVVKSGPFSQFVPDAVRVGDEIYLSGAISVDENGAPVHAGDFIGQMRQVYANIAAVLEEFDADLSHLVKETVYVTDIQSITGSPESIEKFSAAREEIFGGYPEVSQALIQVSSLIFPDLMVEVVAVARV